MLNMMNDIDKIYEGKDVVFVKKTNTYMCPVCGKDYKRESIAKNHMTKRDCYDIKSLIRGTEREKDAFVMFKSIMAEIAPNARVSIMRFRTNKLYNQVCRFTLNCSYYEIKNPELYFAWVRDVKGFKMANSIISNSLKENVVFEYREWLMQNPEYIDSARFIARNDLENFEDMHYLVRSFEKAHLSLVYFLQYVGLSFEDLYDSCEELEYKTRLIEIKQKTYGEK